MKLHMTPEEIANIRKRPGLYTSGTDVRGVYRLFFTFVEAVIYESKQSDVCMEISIDDSDTFHIACDCIPGEMVNLWRDVLYALSCDFDFAVEQDAFQIKFKPDKAVFSYDAIEYYRIQGRLTELAQLNTNVAFTLAQGANRNVIHFPSGLEAMLMGCVYEFGIPLGAKPLNIRFVSEDVTVNASMIYGYSGDVTLSYVNSGKTHDGGTHAKGLIDGILGAFKRYLPHMDTRFAKNHPMFCLLESINDEPYVFDVAPKILRRDVVEGLNYVISLTMERPEQYAGNTMRKLMNRDVYTIVKQGVVEALGCILEKDPDFFYSSRVVQKAEIREILSSKI